MPWDSSSLWLGTLETSPGEGPRLASKTLIAGGEGISVLQPEFSPDGRWLAYISDQSGWWQIHIYDLDSGESRQLTWVPAEHALPPWLQNQNTYGFSSDSKKLYFLRSQEGYRSLWVLDLGKGGETRIELDEKYTWLDWFSISPQEERMALITSASDLPPRLITVDPSGHTKTIRHSTQEDLPRELFSIPQPISWTNSEGISTKGLFYPPHNPAFQADGLPPLLVIIHSGPTRQKYAEFSPRTQLFTSRGYAVLEVNYRGSSGYGRAYRQSLKSRSGVIDVEDSLEGAFYVTDQGWADRDRIALLGSSSGGLTVYQILVRHPGIFQAGIVLYGIVNQLDLLKDPLKFERHYPDWLIGPYPENEKLYRERSPIFFADRIQDPIAIFQGGKDSIVPRDQADQIARVLEENQVPHLYRLYPEEGHGFKAVENIEDFYQQSLDFLNHHLGIFKGG
jgi:dipeptidyl aminopeptidase/acylaminoacyl peptidase